MPKECSIVEGYVNAITQAKSFICYFMQFFTLTTKDIENQYFIGWDKDCVEYKVSDTPSSVGLPVYNSNTW